MTISLAELRELKQKTDSFQPIVESRLSVAAAPGKVIPFFPGLSVLVDTQRSGIFDVREATWRNEAQDVMVEEFMPFLGFFDEDSTGIEGFSTSVLASNMSMMMIPGNADDISTRAPVLFDFQWNVFRGSSFNTLLPPTQQSTLLSRNGMGFYGRDQNLRFPRGMYVRAGEALTVRIKPTLCLSTPSVSSSLTGLPPRFIRVGVGMVAMRDSQRAWPTARPVAGVLR